MMITVFGGSGSGKSERAEWIATRLGKQPIYVATMLSYGEEGKQRVERHRALRAGKGFVTLEWPLFLEEIQIPEGSVVLLEDLPNLVANELFDRRGRGEGTSDLILQGLRRLKKRAKDVVVVTGNVAEAGDDFQGTMQEYMQVLQSCNKALMELSERVEEVLCGIPWEWKYEHDKSFDSCICNVYKDSYAEGHME